MVGRAHAPTARFGRTTPAAESSSSMTSWSNGSADRPREPASAAPRVPSPPARRAGPRPLRRHLLHQAVATARRSSASGGRSAARRGAPARASRPHLPRGPDVGHELAGRHGPLQVEVGVVLPGEADPSEYLDALLGAVGRRIEGQYTRHLRAQGALVARRRAVVSDHAAAASHATAAACSTSTSMSAKACLTAWNCPMGRPNCTRTLA